MTCSKKNHNNMNEANYLRYIRILSKNPNYNLTADELSLFSEYTKMYDKQLRKLKIFNLADKNNIQRYDIPYCQLEYLSTPLWQEEETFKVYKVNIKSGVETQLYLYTHFIPEIVTIDDNNYIIALNFKCLSCNCECEYIRISGRFGIIIEDDFYNSIYQIMFSNLATTILNGNSCKQNIKSESTGNYQVTYYDKASNASASNSSKFNSNPTMIYTYPQIADVIGFYKQYFLTI